MVSSRKLPLFLLVVAAVHAAAAAAPVPAPAPAPAPAQEYCGDLLAVAGVTECRSFVFGGAAAPSPACCAAYAAVYASGEESLCLCYLADGTFWRANGYSGDDANVTGDSSLIPDSCGQASPPIEFWCEESGLELPPYGPQGTPAQPPTSAGAGAPTTAQPPSAHSVVVVSSIAKAKRPELLMLLVAVAALCSIVI